MPPIRKIISIQPAGPEVGPVRAAASGVCEACTRGLGAHGIAHDRLITVEEQQGFQFDGALATQALAALEGLSLEAYNELLQTIKSQPTAALLLLRVVILYEEHIKSLRDIFTDNIRQPILIH